MPHTRVQILVIVHDTIFRSRKEQYQTLRVPGFEGVGTREWGEKCTYRLDSSLEFLQLHVQDKLKLVRASNALKT